MASRAKFALIGERKVDRRLASLGARVANKVVRQATRAAMKPVQAEVKFQEPKGETGALGRSVILRAGKRSRRLISIVVGIEEEKFKAPKWYAVFKELGTHIMKAFPAMRRAYDNTRGPARRAAIRAIRAGALREAGKD